MMTATNKASSLSASGICAGLFTLAKSTLTPFCNIGNPKKVWVRVPVPSDNYDILQDNRRKLKGQHLPVTIRVHGRDSRTCRKFAGRQRFSIELLKSRHSHAGRSAERFGSDEPGGTES